MRSYSASVTEREADATTHNVIWELLVPIIPDHVCASLFPCSTQDLLYYLDLVTAYYTVIFIVIEQNWLLCAFAEELPLDSWFLPLRNPPSLEYLTKQNKQNSKHLEVSKAANKIVRGFYNQYYL